MGEIPAGTGCGNLSGLAACNSFQAASATRPVPFCDPSPQVITQANVLQVGGKTFALEGVIGAGGSTLQTTNNYSIKVTIILLSGSTQSYNIILTAQL
jgi:hypothetical protein